ncbi:DUF4386 family protein [Deinococcus roseus]|uniref:DUF4386 domain-containing protein n=1 Tax=Deinococcus roseus TaxID=392414 RepID=A0ABQ2D456_9DEIO|nr:DUF4386 family protein [Deinococcus roseus]GGJ42371.1 hypothetical protein GCM10008938_30650 [Deinococcus roseus]
MNPSTTHFKNLGGLSALINGIAYIIGLGLALTLLAPTMQADPATQVAFMAQNQTLLALWHLCIYLIAGVFMVPLSLAFHERLKAGSVALVQTATAFGLIWAVTIIGSGMLNINDLGVVSRLHSQNPEQAVTVWMALSAVERGLGGAIELPGGIWTLLVSLAALQTRQLPTALNVLGILVGSAGILTVLPVLSDLGSVFGLGMVLWFLWAGIVLMGKPSRKAVLA